MDYCFDTSAINRLHDDPSRQAIATKLLGTNHVFITALNIVEAALTEDLARRISLLVLQQELSNNERPLSLPTEILRQLSMAYVQKLPSADIAIDDSDAQFWWILHEPEKLTEIDRQGYPRTKLRREEEPGND